VYEPHLYFSDRGREAIDRARSMIEWVFLNTPALELHGKTPIMCRGAWYVARQCGFKRLKIIQTDYSPMYLSILTRGMWLENRKELNGVSKYI
jgi:hypothetical protein